MPGPRRCWLPEGGPRYNDWNAHLNQINHYYLGDEAEIKKAMEAVAAQGKAK